MPYTHKKVGTKYVVYKGNKKVGETAGTKTALDKYLAALHIADKKQQLKKEAEILKESMVDMMDMQSEPSQHDHPGCDDTVGKIFVVLKPTPGTAPVDLVKPTHAFGMGQYDPQGVHGVYNDEEEANLVAEAACNELHKRLTGLEKKKDTILDKITEKIAHYQKAINKHMKEATDNPELAERHHKLAERKMQAIGALRGKHRMVKEAKKEVPEKQQVKK
jgi:hypothetical protein